MNTSTKILTLTLASALLSCTALALSNNHNPSDYSVVALKDCKVVSNCAMTNEQLDTFLKLKQQEQTMQSLEIPLEAIEKEAKQYTDALQKLAKLAIQDTDKSLYIDKSQMQQHQDVAQKFTDFMQQHQAGFAAIGKQGRIIGEYAEAFESSIKISLQGIEYDQIQVITPNSNSAEPYCDQDMRISVI
jgi:uncharacterized protein (DUF342 family)